LNGVARFGKITRLEQFSESKILENLLDTGGIAGVGRHPDIEVGGKSRVAVKRHRVTTDNQILNPV
jgi:hypothetical protein